MAGRRQSPRPRRWGTQTSSPGVRGSGGGRGEGLPLGLRSLLTLRPDFGSLLEGSFPGSTCSAPLCEAPSSSPAPTPPSPVCLSHCAVSISSPSLGLPVSVSCRLFLSQGSPFFSFPASLGLSLCPPCPPLCRPKETPRAGSGLSAIPLKHLPSVPLLSPHSPSMRGPSP